MDELLEASSHLKVFIQSKTKTRHGFGSKFYCLEQLLFFPPVWPIRTRLGPYNCVSSEKQECTRTRVVQKLRQIITKTPTNKKTKKTHNQKRPANPPARFAFRHKARQRSNKERGRAQQEPKQKTLRFALDTATLATVSSSKTCKLINCGGA